MRSLQGFASQATAAYGKLNATLTALIPTVQAAGRAFGAMRDMLKATVAHIDAASSSFRRMRAILASTIPIVAALSYQLGQLGVVARGSSLVVSSAMGTIASSSARAAATVGAVNAGLLVTLAPFALIAAAATSAYVAIFKWESVPTILKPILFLLNPIVMAIRSVALAWSVATLPMRAFTGSVGLASSAVTGLVKSVASLPSALLRVGSAAMSVGKSLVNSIASGASSALSAMKSLASGALGFLGRLGSSLDSAGAALKGLVSSAVDPITNAAMEFGKAGTAAIAFAVAVGLSVEDATALGYAAEKSGVSIEQMYAQVQDGTASLAAMRAEAQRLGLVLTGPQAAAARELTEAYAEMRFSLVGLWRTIGSAVAPQLAEAARQTAVVVKATTNWLAKNGPLVAQLFKIASTIATVGTGLATLGSVLAAATPGLVALTGAALAGYAAWGRYGQSIESAFSSVFAFARNAYQETMRVMGGIWDALQGGDLELAVEVAIAGALRAWTVGMATLAELSNATFGGILNALASGEWRLAADQAWTAIQTVFVQGVSALDSVWTGLTNTIDAAITYLRQQINVVIKEIARFGLAALSQANDVARMLAKYDPTGKLEVARQEAVRSVNQSGLSGLARTNTDGVNAGLAAQADTRQQGRLGELAGRQASRDEQLRQLGFAAQTAQGQAGMAATERDVATRDRLQRAMDAALAARELAALNTRQDERRREQMQAGAQAAQASGGGFGATFSATALMSLGQTAQERAAKAAEATLGRLDKLIALEQKRQKEQRAAELEFVA